MGELNGRRGMFPSNFCQPYSGGGGHTSAPQVRCILCIPPHARTQRASLTRARTYMRTQGGQEGYYEGGEGGDGAAAYEETPSPRVMGVPLFGGAGQSNELMEKLKRRYTASQLCAPPSMADSTSCVSCRWSCRVACVLQCAVQDASDTEGGNAGSHGGLASARGCAQLSDVARRRRRRPCGLGLGARRLWRPARQRPLRRTKRPRHARRTTHCR
jgi:hypothetical protein